MRFVQADVSDNPDKAVFRLPDGRVHARRVACWRFDDETGTPMVLDKDDRHLVSAEDYAAQVGAEFLKVEP